MQKITKGYNLPAKYADYIEKHNNLKQIIFIDINQDMINLYKKELNV